MLKTTFLSLFLSFGLSLQSYSQADDTLRVMTYNLLNYRNNSIPGCRNTNNNPTTKENALKTIIDHTLPDILICNEINDGSSLPAFRILQNAMNQSGRSYYDFTNIQIGQNQQNNSSSTANMIYFDSSKVKLKNSDYIEQDVYGGFLVRVIDLYTLYYKDPNLAQHQDTTFLYIFAAHLKAGSGSTDQLQRDRATEAVMARLDSINASGNYLFAGDLNLYRSTEAAYQNLLNYYDTSLRFYDPVNVAGNWSNNSPYAIVHTQSSRSISSCGAGGGMDDRFDFILASDEVMSGTDSLRYIANSYVAVGQDGQHFNQAINSNPTNNSVPANVLQALVDVSDHLPVMMDMEVKLPNANSLSRQFEFKKPIFNNPVDEQLKLIFKEEGVIERVEILDASGRLKRTINTLKKSEYLIDCSDWKNGVYFIRCRTKKGIISIQKLIKI